MEIFWSFIKYTIKKNPLLHENFLKIGQKTLLSFNFFIGVIKNFQSVLQRNLSTNNKKKTVLLSRGHHAPLFLMKNFKQNLNFSEIRYNKVGRLEDMFYLKGLLHLSMRPSPICFAQKKTFKAQARISLSWFRRKWIKRYCMQIIVYFLSLLKLTREPNT